MCAVLQPGGEEPSGSQGEAQRLRSANAAGTMLAALWLRGRTCPRPKYVHALLGPHQRPPAGRRSQGLGEARAPVCRRVTLLGCAEPAPPLGASDAMRLELCIKRAQGNLSLCEGENVILYLVLLCIFFCKHETVVGSKNCFSVKVTGSQRRWNSTEGTNKVSWAHLQRQAGSCSVRTAPRCQTRV